ncbi:hypothetical protein FOZ61_007601 [Perkinsus olseni]|uniref:Aluminum-activated malate transporter 1 n=1 Tax=Perkinsus olseni TaxID=32597 RepID=A0A7J6L857_PEROL|nr:hypothetical protein FOZ61_007601 [Perkinsus olseni]
MTGYASSYVIPQFPRYQLLNALYTGVVACLCAIPQFLPVLEENLNRHLYALAIVWSLNTSSLDFPTAREMSWKIFMGSCGGACLASAVVSLATAMNQGVYNPFWGTLLATPVCFAVATGQRSKFVNVYSYISCLLRMYSVVTFGGALPFVKIFSEMLAGCIAGFVPLTLVAILNCLNWLPRSRPNPLPLYEHSSTSFLESSVCFILDGERHRDELDRKLRKLASSRRAVMSSTTNDALKLCVFRMTGFLDCLRVSCTLDAFSSAAVKYFWEPVQTDMWYLVSGSIALLRDGPTRYDPAELEEAGKRLRIQIKETMMNYSRDVADRKSVLVSTREMARAESAMLATPRFSILAAEYARLKCSDGKASRTIESYVPLPVWLRHPVLWFHRPLYPPKTPTCEKLSFPLRLCTTLTIILLSILCAGTRFEIVKSEGYWIAVSAITCFLPTLGATLGKGFRRLMGALLGGVLALVAVTVHPNDKDAFMLELFLIASAAKFLMQLPKIGYAGMQMCTTFVIVGFANGIDDTLSEPKRRELAALRMLFTVLGLLVSLVLCVVTYPTFCCRRLARGTAEEIDTIAGVVASGIEALVQRNPDSQGANDCFKGLLETGTVLLDANSARVAESPWADEETVFLGLLGINPSRCKVHAKSILSGQRLVTRVITSALVAYDNLKNCDERMSATSDHLLLEPVRPLLTELSSKLLVSATEIQDVLVGKADVEAARDATAETLEAMVRIFAQFADVRSKLLYSRTWTAEREVTASTKMVEVFSSGGGVGLHEALHNVGVFIEDWVALANALLGSDVRPPNMPAEDIELVPYGASETKPKRRRSRAITAATFSYKRRSREHLI